MNILFFIITSSLHQKVYQSIKINYHVFNINLIPFNFTMPSTLRSILDRR